MIVYQGHLQVSPADVEAYMADLKSAIAETRREPGCLFYDIAVSDAAEGIILVAEQWKDQASVNDHIGSKTYQERSKRWQGRVKAAVQKFIIPD